MKLERGRESWQLKIGKSGRFEVWAEPLWLRNRKGEGSFGFLIRPTGMSVYFGKHLWVGRWGKM